MSKSYVAINVRDVTHIYLVGEACRSREARDDFGRIFHFAATQVFRTKYAIISVTPLRITARQQRHSVQTLHRLYVRYSGRALYRRAA